MIHRTRLALLGLVALAASSVAMADDIVHFANGTFMKVQGYTVEGDMVKVTLGPGATMSFPRTLVESIERSGRTIWPQASGSTANVVASGSGVGGMASGGGQYIQSGADQVPSRHRAGATSGESGIDAKAAGERPDQAEYQMSGSRAPLRALGRRSAPIGEALVEKDSNAPPPGVARPRGFTSLAPRGISSSPTATPGTPAPEPTEPPPTDTEPPQEEPPAEGGD